MKIQPIITDEQLRDFRDGILPERERRLVAILIGVDDGLADRLSEIRAEFPAMTPMSPSATFSKKIMAQLAAENLVQEPVLQRKSPWVIKGFFVVLTVFFIGSLLLAIKSISTANVQLPEINYQVDWAKIINGRAFLWSVWLNCLLPAILLVHQQLNKPKDLGFGKTNLP